MSDDLPYRVEYAKSDRSKCQLCKAGIGKLSLRLAAIVQVTRPLETARATRMRSLHVLFTLRDIHVGNLPIVGS